MGEVDDRRAALGAHQIEHDRRSRVIDELLSQHLAATYFAEYQLLRNELTATLHDEDLAFRPAAGAASLGELCREIGDIERSYIEAFRTFRQDFGGRTTDPVIERDARALAAWFADLDRDLAAALDALSRDDVTSRRITRHDVDVEDFAPLPPQELDIYREALLIFYGKASVYIRAMGRPLPGHWSAWIG